MIYIMMCLYRSLCVVRILKSRRLRQTVYVAEMGGGGWGGVDKENIQNFGGRRPLGRLRITLRWNLGRQVVRMKVGSNWLRTVPSGGFWY